MRKMIIDDLAQIKGKIALSFSTSTGYFGLKLTKGPILSNFLVKINDFPMTAMVLVFLVCGQCIDQEYCQKLVKLS